MTMNESEHYPRRNVTLLPGDTIEATYIKPKNSPFNPATLKRLFGWKDGQRYKGIIRKSAKNVMGEGSRLLVDFIDLEKRKHQCTHVVYNVELLIAKGELQEVTYQPNPQPELFNDEP